MSQPDKSAQVFRDMLQSLVFAVEDVVADPRHICSKTAERVLHDAKCLLAKTEENPEPVPLPPSRMTH